MVVVLIVLLQMLKIVTNTKTSRIKISRHKETYNDRMKSGVLCNVLCMCLYSSRQRQRGRKKEQEKEKTEREKNETVEEKMQKLCLRLFICDSIEILMQFFSCKPAHNTYILYRVESHSNVCFFDPQAFSLSLSLTNSPYNRPL